LEDCPLSPDGAVYLREVMAQRGRPHILERFAAKSGTSFMAVKYFLRNCEFVPAMKSSFSSNSAAYLLSEWHALCTWSDKKESFSLSGHVYEGLV